MAKLKKLGIMSVAKFQAVLMAIMGFIYGIFLTIFLSTLGGALSAFPGVASTFTNLGILSIILFPILFAILGFIGGAISAFLYNLIAGFVGGIEMEFEE